DAALVTLDLTALYARLGAVAEVKALSLEMSRIFQAQDVPREALAALLFFQKAAERERATAKLAREIGVFLEKLRSDPGLTLDWPKLGSWQRDPAALKPADLANLRASGVKVFHPAVDPDDPHPYEAARGWLAGWDRLLQTRPDCFVRVDSGQGFQRVQAEG